MTILRYILIQLPGAVLFGLLLLFVKTRIEFSPELFWLILGLWIFKDGLLFPFVRSAYEQEAESEIYSMKGLYGYAQEDLNPIGYVKVQGELWKARTTEAETQIKKGQPIVVKAQKGLLLTVEPPILERAKR